jgi:cytochrome c-type biogenesis protein CcmE
MSTKENRQDDEIYILGSEIQQKRNKINVRSKWIIPAIIAFAVILLAVIYIIISSKKQEIEYYFEPEETLQQSISVATTDNDSLYQKGYIETQEETVNNVALILHIPLNATMTLELGVPDKSDSTIVFTTMAADIRKDNKMIVGEFVLKGKQIARGIAKKGFCAVIDNVISIGMGDDTPLLRQTIENNGFFFRQYPLVSNCVPLENNPVNKSIRRALAVRNEQVMMIVSRDALTFHDFSQALAGAGISDAIYLVGGSAYGWYYNKEPVIHEFGEAAPDFPEYTSFIVWRTK